MPWDNTRSGTDPKYRTREHRELRAKYARLIKAGDVVLCSEGECLFDDRLITETNGNLPNGLHLAHADDGVTYKGASHRACNLRDGAVRARARQGGTGRWVF